MTRTGVRCASCLAFALTALCGAWTANAYAAHAGGIDSISNEFWLGLFATCLFSLLAAYVQGLKSGVENRLKALEHETKQQQTQINLLREDMLRDHPTKEETTQHREHVEDELRYIRSRLDELFGGRRR